MAVTTTWLHHSSPRFTRRSTSPFPSHWPRTSSMPGTRRDTWSMSAMSRLSSFTTAWPPSSRAHNPTPSRNTLGIPKHRDARCFGMPSVFLLGVGLCALDEGGHAVVKLLKRLIADIDHVSRLVPGILDVLGQ